MPMEPDTQLNFTAVCGWAIPPSWLENRIKEAFPDARVQVVYPENPAEDKEAISLASQFPNSLWIGYSLGSLWLMHHASHFSRNTRFALLAPIPGFLKKHEKGGKTEEAQLNYLIKSLKRNPDPHELLRQFYKVGGLNISVSDMQDLPAKDILLNGLEFLKNISISRSPGQSQVSVVGRLDSLMDAEELQEHLPNLKVVPRAGHNPEPLLETLRHLFQTDKSLSFFSKAGNE